MRVDKNSRGGMAGEGGLACHCLPFIALIEGSLVRASQRLFTRPGKNDARGGEWREGGEGRIREVLRCYVVVLVFVRDNMVPREL